MLFSHCILQPLPAAARQLRRAALVAPLLLAACGHALPELPGLDAAAWRADRYACQNQRAAQLPAIMQARERLYDARANDVHALFGSPDEEELRAGTEKVYYYYLASGTQCQPPHVRSSAPRLSIRFGSLGTVTEVLADPIVDE